MSDEHSVAKEESGLPRLDKAERQVLEDLLVGEFKGKNPDDLDLIFRRVKDRLALLASPMKDEEFIQYRRPPDEPKLKEELVRELETVQ